MNIWLAIINQELNLKIIGLNLCFLVKKKNYPDLQRRDC
jgi:hypothetical protein